MAWYSEKAAKEFLLALSCGDSNNEAARRLWAECGPTPARLFYQWLKNSRQHEAEGRFDSKFILWDFFGYKRPLYLHEAYEKIRRGEIQIRGAPLPLPAPSRASAESKLAEMVESSPLVRDLRAQLKVLQENGPQPTPPPGRVNPDYRVRVAPNDPPEGGAAPSLTNVEPVAPPARAAGRVERPAYAKPLKARSIGFDRSKIDARHF
jgi:hypothetical protein